MLLGIKARAEHAALPGPPLSPLSRTTRTPATKSSILLSASSGNAHIRMFWSQHSPVAPSVEAARNRSPRGSGLLAGPNGPHAQSRPATSGLSPARPATRPDHTRRPRRHRRPRHRRRLPPRRPPPAGDGTIVRLKTASRAGAYRQIVVAIERAAAATSGPPAADPPVVRGASSTMVRQTCTWRTGISGQPRPGEPRPGRWAAGPCLVFHR
jgi:hypothetical protein